jgi:hypothetical protein
MMMQMFQIMTIATDIVTTATATDTATATAVEKIIPRVFSSS